MAILKAIKSKGKVGGILKYIMNPEKTKDGSYISTLHCQADSAADEMQITKEYFHKTGGVQYYHFVHSFPPGESVTPEEVNKLSKKLAETYFPGHEAVIATHTDRDHLHSHIVVNSVSMENGKKIHMSKQDLRDIKTLCNDLSRSYGLSIPDKQETITAYRPEKYMAILRGQAEGLSYKSYVLETAIAVVKAKNTATSREDFITKMSEQGYAVRWEDTRKYITFTDKDGHKVRNKNLTDTFKQDFTKEGLINEFKRNYERQNKHTEFERHVGYTGNIGCSDNRNNIQRTFPQETPYPQKAGSDRHTGELAGEDLLYRPPRSKGRSR